MRRRELDAPYRLTRKRRHGMAAASARVQRERKPRWGPVSKSQELLYPDDALVKCILLSIEPDRVGAVAPADQLAARPSRQGPGLVQVLLTQAVARHGQEKHSGNAASRQPSSRVRAPGSRRCGQPTVSSRPPAVPARPGAASRATSRSMPRSATWPIVDFVKWAARPQGRRLAAIERDAGRARFQPRLAARPGLHHAIRRRRRPALDTHPQVARPRLRRS